MRTIEINLYNFEELSEESQTKAIESNSDINVSFDWWTSTYEDAKRIGLKITSFDLDRNKEANGNLTTDTHQAAKNIIAEHGNICETYKIAKQFLRFWNDAVKLHSDGKNISKVREGNEDYFDEYVEEYEDYFLKHLLNEYSNILQMESEHLQSDEAIKETLIVNEYDFTEHGKIY
jgi:hypothetical protein